MPKSATDKILDEVMKDAPQHIAKILDFRRSISESRAEYLDAKEHANECKKAFEGARQKMENYVKDLTEANMFDAAKEGKTKKGKDPVKTEQTELQPVWPFPLPDDLREVGLGDVSMNPNVKSFSSATVGLLSDKSIKTAGDVEKYCCGGEKFTDPTLAKAAMEKFMKDFGQRQGCIVLNALAAVKANWKPADAPKKNWPFPVDGPKADHTITQVNRTYPRTVVTAVLTKLAESNLCVISDLNKFLEGGTIDPLAGLIGPGPAKKLVDAITKYMAEAE